MIARVIQGSFVGGGPRLPPAQDDAAPARAGGGPIKIGGVRGSSEVTLYIAR